MIFESLNEALLRRELIMVEGGMCRFRHRADGQLTVLEILSSRPGAGSRMLRMLEERRPMYILARCPADLPANAWWGRRGFKNIATEAARSGRLINVWVK